MFAVLKAAESVGDMDADIAREEHQHAVVEESDKSVESMEEMHLVDSPRDQRLKRIFKIYIWRSKVLRTPFVSYSFCKD